MTIKTAALKSAKSLWNYLPWMLGTLLLISLIVKIIPESFYSSVFSNSIISDSIIGSFVGSISAGNPITSYILGGELLSQGISLIAVTAFLVSWVTVGVIQFPAESAIFGKRFALIRNITSFIFAIVVAVITVLIMGLIA